jgi:hypothetical protein
MTTVGDQVIGFAGLYVTFPKGSWDKQSLFIMLCNKRRRDTNRRWKPSETSPGINNIGLDRQTPEQKVRGSNPLGRTI